VAFLPYRNDVFVNYLASRINFVTYNIGGDKALSAAKKHWPETMANFRMGQIGKYFFQRSLMLLAEGDVDAIVLPYIDLLKSAHSWPAPLKYKDILKPVITKLTESRYVEIVEREFYAVVRLSKKHLDSAQLDSEFFQGYCIPPNCLQYNGDSPISNQVGKYSGTGMHTDGRAGYLMFGPYQRMKAGKYVLQVTGNVKYKGEGVVVDVVHHKEGKVYGRYKGLGTQNNLIGNILLEERLTLDEDVPALEIRVRVDEAVDLFVDGYTLMPISNEKKVK
jgi:hypothetical protein